MECQHSPEDRPHNVPAVLVVAVNVQVPENGQQSAVTVAPVMAVTHHSAHGKALTGCTPTV